MNKEELIEKLRKIKKGALALSLAVSMTAGMTGCGQKSDDATPLTELASNDDADDLEYYNIDITKLESEKHDFKSNFYPVRMAQVVEKEEYGTNFFNDRMAGFYNKNLKYVWPEAYATYSTAWLNSGNFDFTLVVEKLDELDSSNEYIIYRSSMTAKRDLHSVSVNTPLLPGQRYIEEGDTISSVAIFLDDELIGYTQTGIGSDCENVQNAIKGDVDGALTRVYNIDKTKQSSKTLIK